MTWPVFRHEAMATHFELAVAGQRESYARQAAGAAWRELDRIEGELSRFIESSDIARANRLRPGETMAVGEAALECLLIAADVALATQRAFDAAYASERAADAAVDAPPFTLDLKAHTLTSRCPHLQLDLGAIGKGYALDLLATTLGEWEIGSACLNAGGSTVLALGAPPEQDGWPVGLGEGRGARTVVLTQAALSASGTAVKGAHLIDPRTKALAARTARVWALAPDAATADALSTAFFVMKEAEIAAFCTEHPHVGAALAAPDDELIVHGALRAACGLSP